MTVLATHLAKFLREHLPRERNASPHTVAAYAHSFTLLVRFAAERRKRRPTDLAVEDIDPKLVLEFLDHVEESRGNSARTRNTRLAAIRTFFRYLEYQAPACLEQALRIRALPIKRTDAPLIDHLTRDEVQALLAAPNPRTVSGTRDRAMLHLTYAAGLRVSELLSLRVGDFPQQSLATVKISRQRTTGARAAVVARDANRVESMAGGPPIRSGSRTVPQSERRANESGRFCSSTGPTRCNRRPEAAVVGKQARDAACIAAQLRHAYARSDRRHKKSGALARSREHTEHGSLSAR